MLNERLTFSVIHGHDTKSAIIQFLLIWFLRVLLYHDYTTENFQYDESIVQDKSTILARVNFHFTDLEYAKNWRTTHVSRTKELHGTLRRKNKPLVFSRWGTHSFGDIPPSQHSFSSVGGIHSLTVPQSAPHGRYPHRSPEIRDVDWRGGGVTATFLQKANWHDDKPADKRRKKESWGHTL